MPSPRAFDISRLVYNGNMAKSVRGREKSWQLLEVIGSGDAGEVLRVRQELADQSGVLKRPLQNVSGGTIVRQAVQIESEGQILKQLGGVEARRNGLQIHTPLLMDESIQGTSRTSNYFIISEQVQGESISSLLKQLYQGEANFSQVLVLKVLGAAFELLKQVHQLGVIWNDVKMEHIFWEREKDKLSFIDWGNGLLFDPSALPATVDPYVDYQQLFNEGTLLFSQVAPELATQVGWPSNGATLSGQDIDQLQFRVDYLQTYLSMRVIEDELVIKKAARELRDAQTLRLALETKAKLERAGQTVEFGPLFQAVATLVMQLAGQGNLAAAKEVVGLIAGQAEAKTEPKWLITAKLLSMEGEDSRQPLAQLLVALMSESWAEAAWLLKDLHLGLADYDEMLHSIRETALPAGTDLSPVPDLLSEALDNLHVVIIRQQIQNPDDADLLQQLGALAERLSTTLRGWRELAPGDTLGARLLTARQDLNALLEYGLDLPRKRVAWLTNLVASIRAVYHSWGEEDLPKTRQSLWDLFLQDPTMDYLYTIFDHLEDVDAWMRRLRAGPQASETLTCFAKNLQATPLEVINELGTPPWLEEGLSLVDEMAGAIDLEQLQARALAESWPFPWLEYTTLHLDAPAEEERQRPLDTIQKAALDLYHQLLKQEPANQQGLEQVRLHLPRFYSLYKQLHEAFGSLFSALVHEEMDLKAADFPLEDQARVEEAIQVLANVRDWQKDSRQGQLLSTSPTVYYADSPWLVLQQLDQTSRNWRTIVLPLLGEIRQKHWAQLPKVDRSQARLEPLFKTQDALSAFNRNWDRIEYQGFYPELARDMLSQMETASESFFRFWQQSEQSPNPTVRWLVRVNQSFFSGINNTFLQVIRYLRSALHALEVIRQPELARTRLAQNSAGDLMFALVQLQGLVQPPTRGRVVVRDWQQQYLNLLKSGSRLSLRDEIKNIESIHPLLPWFDELAKRDVDYFDLPDQRKW